MTPPADGTDRAARVHLLSDAKAPALELRRGDRWERLPFRAAGAGRRRGERRLVAEVDLDEVALDDGAAPWRFRIVADDARLPDDEGFATPLREVWIQDGALFGYEPAAVVPPARVEKIERFEGRLPARPLYVYLPRGYDRHESRRYPVLYLHDGQNCFAAFEGDSYAGSWRADRAADALIDRGGMRECILVGVANGREARMAEYLPPYSSFVRATRPRAAGAPRPHGARARVVGRADTTADYYRHDVAPFVAERYRTLAGREHAATCGSSMGGLFSAYLAWEHPDFARHHAAMSPSFWITRNDRGEVETVERFRRGPKRDVRLWLDSGTRDAPGRGDDNLRETVMARDALLSIGFRDGDDLRYHRAEGAIHHEGAWAARLPRVLAYLFPPVAG